MEVEARKIEYVKVQIDRRATMEKIMDDMIRVISPPETVKYDDWLINEACVIIGITKYHHTILGLADSKTVEVYRAIQALRRNLDILPSED